MCFRIAATLACSKILKSINESLGLYSIEKSALRAQKSDRMNILFQIKSFKEKLLDSQSKLADEANRGARTLSLDLSSLTTKGIRSLSNKIEDFTSAKELLLDNIFIFLEAYMRACKIHPIFFILVLAISFQQNLGNGSISSNKENNIQKLISSYLELAVEEKIYPKTFLNQSAWCITKKKDPSNTNEYLLDENHYSLKAQNPFYKQILDCCYLLNEFTEIFIKFPMNKQNETLSVMNDAVIDIQTNGSILLNENFLRGYIFRSFLVQLIDEIQQDIDNNQTTYELNEFSLNCLQNFINQCDAGYLSTLNQTELPLEEERQKLQEKIIAFFKEKRKLNELINNFVFLQDETTLQLLIKKILNNADTNQKLGKTLMLNKLIKENEGIFRSIIKDTSSNNSSVELFLICFFIHSEESYKHGQLFPKYKNLPAWFDHHVNQLESHMVYRNIYSSNTTSNSDTNLGVAPYEPYSCLLESPYCDQAKLDYSVTSYPRLFFNENGMFVFSNLINRYSISQTALSLGAPTNINVNKFGKIVIKYARIFDKTKFNDRQMLRRNDY